MIKYMKPS